MINSERVHGLMLRWQTALNQRKYDAHWDPSQGMRSIVHLIHAFPEVPALEVIDWLTGVIETGEAPTTFGDVVDVSSPMALIRNDYRGFRMVMALCPIRC